jgi:hypothetical protein
MIWIEFEPGVYTGHSGQEQVAKVAYMKKSSRWDWIVYGFAAPGRDQSASGSEPECGAAMAAASTAWAGMLARYGLVAGETLAAE